MSEIWYPKVWEKYYTADSMDSNGSYRIIENERHSQAFENNYRSRAINREIFKLKEEAQAEADRKNSLVKEALKPKRWVPSLDEKFWFITSAGETHSFCRLVSDDDFDIKRINIGNCFRTKAEADVCAANFKKWLWESTEPK
jgi:hypothetical protein